MEKRKLSKKRLLQNSHKVLTQPENLCVFCKERAASKDVAYFRAKIFKICHLIAWFVACRNPKSSQNILAPVFLALNYVTSPIS